MTDRITFPSDAHALAAERIIEFFTREPAVDVILLTNSIARGKATPDSCLDLYVMLQLEADLVPLEARWRDHYAHGSSVQTLKTTGKFSDVHLDIDLGDWGVPDHPADEYPDDFEIELGNYLVYAVPVFERSNRLAHLRDRWLPYYDESLRQQRLNEVRWCCLDALDRVESYAHRGLPFAAFDYLWRAFRLFLQALFINKRVYPLAYNKWIHEQIVEILNLPALYRQLPPILEVHPLEGLAIINNAYALRNLLETHVPNGSATERLSLAGE